MTIRWIFTCFIGAVIVLGGVAIAQVTPHETAAAPFRIAGMITEYPAVKGLPYSLAETSTTVKTSTDAVTTEIRESRNMRDSEGRTQIETGRTIGGVFEADHIMITDPGARFQVNFDTSSHTGQVSYLHAPVVRTPEEEVARAERKAEAHKTREARDEASPYVQKLGSRIIAGVDAEGIRRTTIIPAGSQGNANEVHVVTERWSCPVLKILLESCGDDPRNGRGTMVVTNLQRQEPDAALFKIPEGYTLSVH